MNLYFKEKTNEKEKVMHIHEWYKCSGEMKENKTYTDTR